MDPQTFWGNPTGNIASPSAPADGQGQAPAPPPSPGVAGGPITAQAATTPPEQQQPGESNTDYDARIRDYEAQLEAARREAQEARSAVSQVTQGLQQYAMQQQAQATEAQFEQKRADILAFADNLGPQERGAYLNRELGTLDRERNQFWQQRLQQAEQEKQQIAMRFGTPMFIDDLIRQHGLPPEAKTKLMRFQDPNVAAQYAPELKAEYETITNLQNQINQLSRSHQASAMQQAGLGAVGGTAPSAGQVHQPSGDPDTDAMMILAAIRNGTYVAPH